MLFNKIQRGFIFEVYSRSISVEMGWQPNAGSVPYLELPRDFLLNNGGCAVVFLLHVAQSGLRTDQFCSLLVQPDLRQLQLLGRLVDLLGRENYCVRGRTNGANYDTKLPTRPTSGMRPHARANYVTRPQNWANSDTRSRTRANCDTRP